MYMTKLMKTQTDNSYNLIKNVEMNDNGEQKRENQTDEKQFHKKQTKEKEILVKDNAEKSNEGKNSASGNLLQEESMIANDLYKSPNDLSKLASTESISQIKELLIELKKKENEIRKSSINIENRKISLSRVLLVKDRCKIKIRQLKAEKELEEKIGMAGKGKDIHKKERLKEQLVRERRLRQSMEFSYIQSILRKEHLGTEISKYSIYQQNGNTRNIAGQVNEAGNFIDFNIF